MLNPPDPPLPDPSSPTGYARPEAVAALHDALPSLDTTTGLLHAAIAVAYHIEPDRSHRDAERLADHLDDTVGSILETCQSGARQALLAHAHERLFQDLGLRGAQEDYHHPRNSSIFHVMDHHTGLPILLVLFYKAVLDALEVPTVGINAPGHFLAGVCETDDAAADGPHHLQDPSAFTLIDVFNQGRLLSHAEARHAITASLDLHAGTGHPGLIGNPLPIASHSDWLLRILRNLINSYRQQGEPENVLAIAELQQLVEAHR
ncbi:MAG: transglutaminase family protein [Planctomycetota bacterium]